MEFLDTVLGALVAFAGYKVGTRRRTLPSPEGPICGCEHHFAMHDPETKKCHAYVGWHWQDAVRVEDFCMCRQYTGPEPLPEYYG